MPNVSAKIIGTKIDDKGRKLANVQFGSRLPKVGTLIKVSWGAKRSLMQNAFWWVYLTFLFEDCGLKDQYATIEELHETAKATCLSEHLTNGKGIAITKVGSSTDLDKITFGEFMERFDQIVVKYYGIDTSSFWQEYKENYQL